MFSIDKLFIVSDNWWICSNDGRIDIENDIVRDLQGKPMSVKQKTVFVSISSFVKGEIPKHGDKVECIYELDGNNLFFKGSVNNYNGSTCVVNIESEHTKKGIKKICNKINTN
jgi:hypothetical protein